MDFTVKNPRGLKVLCSIWGPKHLRGAGDEDENEEAMPCVVYMHGNSSARVEAVAEIRSVLSIGARLLAFDFSGSGLSEGEYVSLGYFEKDDLQSVVEHLRSDKTMPTSTIALWGRSMGASTALMHGQRDPSIAGMVLDSPFSDLTVLAEELVETGRRQGIFAPGFVVSLAIRFVRSSIQEKAKFDIREISPISHVDKSFIPALFVAAEGDTFINPTHSENLSKKYAGDNQLKKVRGDHNSQRDAAFKEAAIRFLINVLQINPSTVDLDTQNYNSLPWHSNQRGMMMIGASELGATELDLDELLLMNAISLSLRESGGGGAMVAATTSPAQEFGMTNSRQQQLQSTINNAFAFGSTPGNSSGSSSSGSSSSSDSSSGSAISDGEMNRTKPTIKITQGEAQWDCTVCTLINDANVSVCAMCDTPRP